MYYVEEIINGVLCFKSTPNGEWRALTPEQLTDKIVKLRNQNVSNCKVAVEFGYKQCEKGHNIQKAISEWNNL
jgi:hypothetical protein